MRIGPGVVAVVVIVACADSDQGRAADPGPPDGMAYVPGGRFTMGTDSTDLPIIADEFGVPLQLLLPERPQRSVDVEPFYLDVDDVTNAEFLQFVQAKSEWSGGGADTALHNGRYLEHWGPEGPSEDDLDRPVTFVTWYAAVAYCQWRGRRLPTETEWEFAAGGGAPDPMFPWGSDPPSDELVSWSADGIDEPVPVASYPPNGFGLYDMAGNVWKFLADEWRDSHEGELLRPGGLDPDTAAAVTSRRVVRGGSWGAAAVNLRVRYRDSHRPHDAREMVGFRCALSA